MRVGIWMGEDGENGADMEVDADKVRMLAESAERRASEFHAVYNSEEMLSYPQRRAALLNDFFYWSGKATSYRGILAMGELATIVEEEMDATPQCP